MNNVFDIMSYLYYIVTRNNFAKSNKFIYNYFYHIFLYINNYLLYISNLFNFENAYVNVSLDNLEKIMKRNGILFDLNFQRN